MIRLLLAALVILLAALGARGDSVTLEVDPADGTEPATIDGYVITETTSGRPVEIAIVEVANPVVTLTLDPELPVRTFTVEAVRGELRSEPSETWKMLTLEFPVIKSHDMQQWMPHFDRTVIIAVDASEPTNFYTLGPPKTGVIRR